MRWGSRSRLLSLQQLSGNPLQTIFLLRNGGKTINNNASEDIRTCNHMESKTHIELDWRGKPGHRLSIHPKLSNFVILTNALHTIQRNIILYVVGFTVYLKKRHILEHSNDTSKSNVVWYDPTAEGEHSKARGPYSSGASLSIEDIAHVKHRHKTDICSWRMFFPC